MTLLEKMRQMNNLLQKNNAFDVEQNGALPYDRMAMVSGDLLDSNCYIIDEQGILIGLNEKHDVNNQRIKNMFEEKQFPKEYTAAMDRLTETSENVPITSDLTAFPVEARANYPFGVTTIVPIYGAGKRLGTVIFSRMQERFQDEDLVLAEYTASVIGMQVLYQQSRTMEAEIRSTTQVQMALSTLSYSEMKAVKAIFAALGDKEGRLTASSIADEIGITRSVIVNALRKLESAGVIESRSLGMKGTYLKVLNERFFNELAQQS
ncbi:GTP-sensing pleiotropic transcriptional regulator CodY [Enterococcus nangangensis]|uniref:GTP-sensing pleiotropic transcriptional regulator CodY n=1 Tax=Enterococcus nangangensis TaxID=2559926 RepID=UPI0010F5AF1A|nr:GTP-sensing pleiotropic transcriptional regulator CodY [Enterococcus nangangensis]